MMQPIALSAFQDNYIWVIKDEKTFTCVDPGDAAPVLEYARQTRLTLSNILLTHHHHDHTQGVSQLRDAFKQVQVFGPDDERLNTIGPIIHQPSIQIQTHCFKVLYTPGHTASHICYFEPEKHWLFCGDTLFSAGCGRVFDGTMHELYRSLMQLKQLPDDTQVFCGHEYTRKNLQFALSIEPDNQAMQACFNQLNQHPDQCSLPSTILQEKEMNPFFRVNSFQVFEALRRRKDAW